MSKRILIPAFNDQLTPLGVDLGPGLNPAGLICAANEARFTSGFYSTPLTALTIGWKDPENVDAVLQRLFPEISGPRRIEFKKAKNAEAFLTETDDLRPIGSPFKRVEYNGETAYDKTHNRGLTVRIDHDQCDDVEAEKAATVARLQQRCARNSLRRGFVLLDSMDHQGGNTAFKVDTNPDGLIRAMGVLSAETTGIFPNVFAVGELAWSRRLDAYEAPARVNGQARANLTPAQLAQYLGADVVEIVKARYQSTATAKASILSARIYAYLAMQGMSKDDPSAIKRFTSKARNGLRWGVYVQEYEKFTDVSVEYYENNIATGIGVESIDVTNA
jgi:hypothetical protein